MRQHPRQAAPGLPSLGSAGWLEVPPARPSSAPAGGWQRWRGRSWADITFPSSFLLSCSFTGVFPYLREEETRAALWRRATFLSDVQERQRGTWTGAHRGALSPNARHELRGAAIGWAQVGLHSLRQTSPFQGWMAKTSRTATPDPAVREPARGAALELPWRQRRAGAQHAPCRRGQARGWGGEGRGLSRRQIPQGCSGTSVPSGCKPFLRKAPSRQPAAGRDAGKHIVFLLLFP